MTKKIKIITILSSSVMAASAFGVTTGILLSNNHDSKPHKPTIKMENVYSIRDYLLKRYAKVLTNAGDTQEYIDCQVAKVQNDVDSIITDGISGNFSVDQIYSSIYAYGGRINITVYDWVMLDKFIKDSLKTLKQSLIASGLPIAKVNYIYNHYSTMVINEEGKCKQSASSPNEIIEHMKTFGKEMATEAMEEDYEQLAQYQIDNFATSEKIQLVNNLSYYYDNLKRDAETQTDIVPSLTRVLEYDGLGIQSDIINTIINKDGLKSLADKKSNYQLMGKIENFDDSKNLVKIIFSIKDLIHNDKHGDPIVKKASKPFQFYLPFSPTKEVANTANEMKKHHFDFVKDVTFADWAGAIEKIKNVIQEDQYPIDQQKKFSISDLMDTMSAVFKVDNKPLKDSPLFKKFNFKLNVYGFDEQTETVDFEILVNTVGDENIRDNPNSSYEQDHGVPLYPQRTYSLFSRQVVSYPVASEVEIAQLHKVIEQNESLLKIYSKDNCDKLRDSYNIQVAYTTEQAAAATALGVIAGVYYAIAPVTFGATLPSAISCTIAAAACAAGAVIGGISCHTIHKQIDTIERILKKTTYRNWIETSIKLSVHLKEFKDLQTLTETNFRDICVQWAIVWKTSCTLFFTSSVEDERSSLNIFSSWLNMARSDLFSAIYDTPMRIATSFFRSTPEGNFVSFLNGNFVFVGSVFNRLIKGESIDSLTSFIAFTKADGQLIRFSTLPVEYQNVFKNFVIWLTKNPYSFRPLLKMYAEDPSKKTILSEFIEFFGFGKPVEENIADAKQIEKMYEFCDDLIAKLENIIKKVNLNDCLSASEMLDLKKVFYYITLDDETFIPELLDSNVSFAQFPAQRGFYNYWLEFRPGGQGNLNKDEFRRQFDEKWANFVSTFSYEETSDTYVPIKMQGSKEKFSGNQNFGKITFYDRNEKILYINDTVDVGADSHSNFETLLNFSGNRAVGPAASSRPTYIISSESADLRAEFQGIEGFKTYLESLGEQIKSLSSVSKLAIFACPIVETAVFVADIATQIILSILASAYAPF